VAYDTVSSNGGRDGTTAERQSFSERMGIQPQRTQIQTESMDDALRNGLWNILNLRCWDKLNYSVSERPMWTGRYEAVGEIFFRKVWLNFLKQPLDVMPRNLQNALKHIRQLYFGWQWNHVYDFLEFTPIRFPNLMSRRSLGYATLCCGGNYLDSDSSTGPSRRSPPKRSCSRSPKA
jgi:AbiJ N-terminal domain 4